MKKGNSSPMSPALREELKILETASDHGVDTTDMPETTDFAGARRGVYYRVNKRLLSLRVDADLIEWFKARQPRGYQTRMNEALREFVERHSQEPNPSPGPIRK